MTPRRRLATRSPQGLRKGLTVDVRGETAKVSVRIPIIVPGLGHERLRATRSAILPS